MPYSILTYPGDGVTDTFPINFTMGFISRNDVKCRVGNEVDGLGQPIYRTLTWITDGLVQVQGTVASIGQSVEFTRTVSKTTLVHDYEDGAAITEPHLDDSNKQLIMLLHEILDDRLRVQPAYDWDMNENRIVNLADGIALTDAVTVQQAAQAIALTPTAVQAAADAAQALADAEDAKTYAEAAKNDAEAAASDAEALLANAMLKSQNLSDVADKATARANLDVFSKSEVYPTQTGNSGKYLTTDGTTPAWSAVKQYALPSQTGNSGKALVTNGTAESWNYPAQLSTASGSAPSFAARAWVNFSSVGGITIKGSGNVSSITKYATGEYLLNFAVPMPDTNYAFFGSSNGGDRDAHIPYTIIEETKYANKTTSAIRFDSYKDNTALVDLSSIYVVIFR